MLATHLQPSPQPRSLARRYWALARYGWNGDWVIAQIASAVSYTHLDVYKRQIWFTGLSGSGKSTIANALEIELHQQGKRTYILDGDNIRQGLNKDLGFTDADRVENIRRIAEVARLMMDAGMIVMTAFISPFRREREMARELIGSQNFVEVYVSTTLAVCEQRDTKGLYKKARNSQLPNMTEINSPYEAPEQALSLIHI